MLRKIAVMTLALGTAVALHAQGPGPGGPGFGGPWGHEGFGGPHGKPVTGAPFSDVATSNSTETLGDGTKIVHQSQEQSWRDAQGRTRTERTELKSGETATYRHAEIFDPVARTITTLDLDRKVAFVRQLPPPPAGTRPDRPHPEGDARHERSGVTVTESALPAQSFAGISATGKQIVRTVAAGVEGNTNALVNTLKTYIAPDLKIVLYSSDTNQLRDSVHQVTSISTNDPDPTLFQVPAGFTVHSGGGRRGPGGPPPSGE